MNKKFKKMKLLFLGISTVIYIGAAQNVWAISIAEKAREKVEEDRTYIYSIEIALKNFGSAEQKNEYTALRDQYKIGLGYFMEANNESYIKAYKELLEAQKKLDKLYEKISMDYIERTTKILSELVSSIVEIDIKYNRNSDLIKRYTMDIQAPKLGDPATKEQFYSDRESKNFHLTYDKHAISKNLDKGFSHLGDAKRVRQEAVSMEEKKYEDGQTIDPSIYKFRLYNYSSVIDLCREAKKNAMMAYQFMNRNDIEPVQTLYRGNRFVNESNLLPVFDPRIPEQYRVDASDALKLVHEDEVTVKLKHGVKKEEEAPKETPKTETQNTQDQTPKK